MPPSDLAYSVDATQPYSIRVMYAEVKRRLPKDGFALRSSAIGEDTLLSFAGQYATFLNVTEEDLVDNYREVLASK